MKDIFVVTHTQSKHHVQKVVGGWHDTGLTELGEQQAAMVGSRLIEIVGMSQDDVFRGGMFKDRMDKGDKPSITSSDLLRARGTARIIADSFGCDYQTTAQLREISYGDAEGEPRQWLKDRLVPAPEESRLDYPSFTGGETKRQFITRLYQAVDLIIADNNPVQIVVTHGFALTFVVSRWIGLPLESAGYVNFKSPAGGITHLQQDDFWNNRGVKQIGDTSHLK